MADMLSFEDLYRRIQSRRNADPRASYTAELFAAGIDRMAQKVGEEAVEVIIAAKNVDRQALTEEVADLWYHSLVLLAARDLTPQDVYVEFERRAQKKGIGSENSNRGS